MKRLAFRNLVSNLGAMKLSITTLRIMTFSITINEYSIIARHNVFPSVIYAECFLCCVANKPIMLSAIMLSVIMLSVVSVVMLSIVPPQNYNLKYFLS